MNILVTSWLILRRICYRAHRNVKGDEVRDIGRAKAKEAFQRTGPVNIPLYGERCVRPCYYMVI